MNYVWVESDSQTTRQPLTAQGKREGKREGGREGGRQGNELDSQPQISD